MKNKFYMLFKTIVVIFLFITIAAQEDIFAFSVFDGTLYKKKPDLTEYGLKSINIIYGGSLWNTGENKENLPSDSKIQKLAIEFTAKNTVTVLDVEHWEVSLNRSKGKEVENLNKYIALFEKFKKSAPYIKAGFYGVPPIRDYWRAIMPPESKQYIEWQKENEFLRHFAEKVDIIYPSLYTFYKDQDGWKKYAKANISEAKRISNGKPIYVFLWPQYHDSNKILKGQYIEKEYWEFQLKLAKEYADGVVVWGGWQEYWDNKAPWWQVTKEFIKSFTN